MEGCSWAGIESRFLRGVVVVGWDLGSVIVVVVAEGACCFAEGRIGVVGSVLGAWLVVGGWVLVVCWACWGVAWFACLVVACSAAACSGLACLAAVASSVLEQVVEHFACLVIRCIDWTACLVHIACSLLGADLRLFEVVAGFADAAGVACSCSCSDH